jgi:hypothetical protein
MSKQDQFSLKASFIETESYFTEQVVFSASTVLEGEKGV